MTPDDLQTLIENATADYALGDDVTLNIGIEAVLKK